MLEIQGAALPAMNSAGSSSSWQLVGAPLPASPRTRRAVPRGWRDQAARQEGDRRAHRLAQVIRGLKNL